MLLVLTSHIGQVQNVEIQVEWLGFSSIWLTDKGDKCFPNNLNLIRQLEDRVSAALFVLWMEGFFCLNNLIFQAVAI